MDVLCTRFYTVSPLCLCRLKKRVAILSIEVTHLETLGLAVGSSHNWLMGMRGIRYTQESTQPYYTSRRSLPIPGFWWPPFLGVHNQLLGTMMYCSIIICSFIQFILPAASTFMVVYISSKLWIPSKWILLSPNLQPNIFSE